MKLDFIPRTCPLCGGDDAKVLVEATIDEHKLTASAFASRKVPEYMHSRMVECNGCGMSSILSFQAWQIGTFVYRSRWHHPAPKEMPLRSAPIAEAL